jgi:hypothetical protein
MSHNPIDLKTAPIYNMIKAYACGYCGVVYGSLSGVYYHQKKRCWFVPKKRACASCENFKTDTEDYPYSYCDIHHDVVSSHFDKSNLRKDCPDHILGVNHYNYKNSMSPVIKRGKFEAYNTAQSEQEGE